MQEQEAIARLKRGDLSGLEALVRGFQLEAVHAAYLIVGNRPIAEDVVQAAFLKAADKIYQFEDGRPFRPWFLRIVTNDALKAASRASRHVPLDEGTAISTDTWLYGSLPGPEELADTAENRERVWKALQQLTPNQRRTVVMRYFLDMPNKEIAKAQGRPLTSIKWSLHAARERLRGLLRPNDRSEGQASIEESPDENVGGES